MRPLRLFAALFCALASVALFCALPAFADDEGGKAKAAQGVEEKALTSPGDEASHPAKKRRGGINPCMTPDPGFGIYDPWTNVSIGQAVLPHEGGLTKDGGFDLIVHFHGHEAIRK